MAEKPIVNSWTEWGPLEEIIVGRADFATYLEEYSHLNDGPWPYTPTYLPKQLIDEMDVQLNGLIDVLEGECIEVRRSDQKITSRVLHNYGLINDADKEKNIKHKPVIRVKRPELFDFKRPIKSPSWGMETMGNCCNPRDVMITLGNTILEAPMSWRSRFFEYLPYRKLTKEYWHSDCRVLWKTAPKPSMDDDLYDEQYRKLSMKERITRHHDNMTYNLTEYEPAFDAADIMRCGKDIFVNHGYMTNLSGIEWLEREFGHTVRVNQLHIFDARSIHIDSTLVPLRPPNGVRGTEGLLLFNPDRPPVEAEMKLWYDNNWRLVPAPRPVTKKHKNGLVSEWTFNMNLLLLGHDKIVMNSGEIPTYDLLTDLGFDVITCDFDLNTEFGGGIHCATWDVRRDDKCEDFFPYREDAKLLKDMDKSERYQKITEDHRFCILNDRKC